MDTLLQWGLDLIVAIQRIHGPALDSIFRAITFLGETEFHLLLFPLIFWCVDVGTGARLGVFFLLSTYLNTDLKDLFQQPRPFDLDPSVQLASIEGYGLPSGHSQSAVVVWGTLATWVRKSWFWAVAIALMALIGFSRIYLGVHFPTDVLAGWAIGAVLLGIYLVVQPGLEKKLRELSLGTQITLSLAVPIVLLLIHPVKDNTAAMAVLAGVGVGLALMHRYVPVSAGGPWRQRAARFLVGGAVVFPLYVGLKMVFPGEGEALYLVFRFLRFWLIGLWGSLGAPWLFRRLHLAPKTERWT
jgi:membrane-associated phospholipid phosphatase